MDNLAENFGADVSPDAIWSTFLAQVEGKLSAHVLETWLRPVRCREINDDSVVLEVRDQFSRDWLQDHYIDFIRDGLGSALGRTVSIRWEINPELHGPDPLEEACAVDEIEIERTTKVIAESLEMGAARFNTRYNFGNFICGPSNEFALAAAKAVAEKPGRSYNPLFLFGRVGLGKTHLLSAIGAQVMKSHPDANIVYTTSEQFTNEVVNAVLGNKLDDFRQKYRENCDVLLIDDIQLIAGKERTQHEFFHIFNRLYDSQRQIVVTSDKLPHEIPDIEERLRNRFQFGLIADIQAPEVETRVAILRRKGLDEGTELAEDVSFFLAENIRSNVRELEGALVRVLAHASLTGRAITVDYAREVLADIIVSRAQQISTASIQKMVSDYYHVKVSDLKSHRRQKQLVRPRQVAMFLARKHAKASFPDLGAAFGGKDHTTVMSACKRIEKLLEEDQELQHELIDLERKLEGMQK